MPVRHKQYKYLYRQMLDESVIRKAYKNLRKGKTKRKEIQAIDANLDEEVAKMRVMLENTREGAEHPELGFCPPEVRHPKTIFEHGKARTIYMPDIHEQWVHHIIIVILAPIILSTSYPYSCGSFPKRGSHYGMKYLRSKIKKGKGTKYFAKLDIRHFYNNIRVNVMLDELRQVVKDEWFIYVIEVCLRGFSKGIPLGFYISQWLANYLLEPLDRLIVEECGISILLRYMDDLVLMDDNKKRLHYAITASKRLIGRLRLVFKDNYQVARFIYVKKNGQTTGRPIDVMGFVFYRDKVIMRESIMLHITRLAKKMHMAKKSTGKYRARDARAMLSGMGWIKYTDSYDCYLAYIKPYISIKSLKKIVSKEDKKENKEGTEYDGMERGTPCAKTG